MVEITGYELVRRDRNRRGGGVAIYVKNTYPFILRNDLIPNNLEAICIELTPQKSRPLLILTWYRPPDSNTEVFDLYEEFLQKTDSENRVDHPW